MSARAGLVGIYQPPTLQTDSNAVYMIADENNDSLIIFILYPGAYNIAYEIASCAWYRNVFIVPVSLDALYVSDVTRLVNDLYKIKNTVKVLFPGEFSAYVPTPVQKALINSKRKTFYQYKNGVLAFNYKYKLPRYQPNFYDIYATFKTRRCLFCPFEVKKERIMDFLTDNLVDWVYVPYSDPMFGTDSYATIVTDDAFKPYLGKFVAMGFFNITQANYCKGRYPFGFPRTIKAEFLRNQNTTETGNPPVVGGKITIDDPAGLTEPTKEWPQVEMPYKVPKPIKPRLPRVGVVPNHPDRDNPPPPGPEPRPVWDPDSYPPEDYKPKDYGFTDDDDPEIMTSIDLSDLVNDVIDSIPEYGSRY